MHDSLAAVFFNRAHALASRPAVRFKEGKEPYRDMSWTDLSRLVEESAFGLYGLGLEEGQRAAVLAQTSHLWVAADLAILANGAVSVPVYPTSSSSDIEFILANSDSQVLFVQNESLLRKVLAVRSGLPALKKVVLMSAATGSPQDWGGDIVIGLDQLQQLGRAEAARNPRIIRERAARRPVTEAATIIYTSGTTGTPKGVTLTHHNILSVLSDLIEVIPVSEDDVYLSFLPMSHVFERVCGEYYWMKSGGVCAFAEGIEHVAKNMAEVDPTMILVVPRVLDKIYAKVKSGIHGATPTARRLIEWALTVGEEVVQQQSEGRALRSGLAARYWLADRLVLAKMRNRIGSRLRLVVSGGAPATGEVIRFFNSLGITTLEGYGLTETSAPASVNRIGKIKPGTVGPALPSVQARIAEDGEILLKGPSVFSGYFNCDDSTSTAFSDGWFHTGDIGIMDGDGYIKITDRKKDIIVNSAGKNIAPQKVEAVLKSAMLVTQAIVFGDKRKSLVALLTLDEQAAIEYGRDQGWNFASYQELIAMPELSQAIKKDIARLSEPLADYERVRNFAILPADLSVEAGELTATMKVKRNVVAARYADLIESLHREEPANVAVSSKR